MKQLKDPMFYPKKDTFCYRRFFIGFSFKVWYKTNNCIYINQYDCYLVLKRILTKDEFVVNFFTVKVNNCYPNLLNLIKIEICMDLCTPFDLITKYIIEIWILI